jgi:hypothetical protein
MMKIEHLTDNQLNAYFGDPALERDAKHEIGRHLLQCDDCLKKLPQPAPAHFWAALLTDEIDAGSSEEKESMMERLKFIASQFKQQNVLVWSAGALAILLFFSAFIWLAAVKSSEPEREIAGNFENIQSVIAKTEPDRVQKTTVFPDVQNANRSIEIPSNIQLEKKPPFNSKNLPKRNPLTIVQNSSKAETQVNLPNDKKPSISATRGGESPNECGSEGQADLAIEMVGETIVLKWKKVPKASKYHLYVYDEDEILLDEYETEQETSYVLKKPLDPQKIYKWKVVITLENGNTIMGNSQKFTVKDIQQDTKKSEKNKKSIVRCTASN